MPDLPCIGCRNCPDHPHTNDQGDTVDPSQTHLNNDLELGTSSIATGSAIKNETKYPQGGHHQNDRVEVGFRRIIRNFTPSYVYILVIDVDHADHSGLLIVGISLP